MTLDIPQDPSQEVIIPAAPLKQLMVDMLMQKGMTAEDADIGASRLLEADLRGIHSHGSRAIDRYLKAMDDGLIDPRAEFCIQRETAAMAVVDGRMGMGHVTSTRAMLLAIEKAAAFGTGTVAVKRSQHYGAASVYTLLAVDAGMIGYSTTNTAWATVAALGSREAAIANNAFSWSVPTRTGPPFVLDTACAVSSWGKVQSLGMYGRRIPDDWALDAAGHPTTDPTEAKTLLPAAGARGYGLAFMSSVLAGPLVGGRMPLHKSRQVEKDGSEHFFYAIDFRHFVEPDEFYAEVESTMADIRKLTPADGFDKVRLPGELEWERQQRWQAEGIPMHRDHVKKLEGLAEDMQLNIPW
jgi:ureidoglycolate dehydrogenase (NAD+)